MRFFLSCLVILVYSSVFAQFPQSHSSAHLYHELIKAAHTGNVLYIAAHPDDENTRLISYLENHLYSRTAYLSLTRGDGGQNLVGTETGAAIGVLRTQELLEARAIDGGEQFFTRAVDFGYSKSSLETLEKWGKEALMHDVVWIIRKFRPDIIITRFPPNNYAGHGHHEASALLAEEAFDLAADPSAFPEQLTHVGLWQPKRLYFNTSSWWIDNLAEKARESDLFIQVNVGAYNALLGESYAQIAARSRSEHKSQGFGSDYPFGLNIEYLEYVKGEKVPRGEDIFYGVDRTWSRLGSKDAGLIIEEAIKEFNWREPAAAIPRLIDVLRLLSNAEKTREVQYKIDELEELIGKLAGIRLEAYAPEKYYTPGEKVTFRLQTIQSAFPETELTAITYRDTTINKSEKLMQNELFSQEFSVILGEDEPLSNPYWLNAPYQGLYQVSGYQNLGKPDSDSFLEVVAHYNVQGYPLKLKVPLRHKIVDPVKAVRYTPVRVVPRLTFNFSESCLVMTEGNAGRKLAVLLQNNSDSAHGQLSLQLPEGWVASPVVWEYKFDKRGEVKRFEFLVESTGQPSSDGTVEIMCKPFGGKVVPALGLQVIQYDHIPEQIILSPAGIPLRTINLDKGEAQQIGYIEGPGDEVAKYLQAVGFEVEILTEDVIQSGDLMHFDAIITGIRAYNTRPELAYLNDRLSDYIFSGGTLIVQYNTSRGLLTEQIGPYPFSIGRERVTDEHAEPAFPDPGHSVLNYPNKLTLADFDQWVQERGLYFAGQRDPAFETILTWSDPGEPPRDGGLIAAPYGKGYFVYTGISFFRQLPAGVPGAYRLLANLMNLSDNGK